MIQYKHHIYSLLILGLLWGCAWESNFEDSSYLVLDDTEYPYAGLPRIVIETEDFKTIRDNYTEIPAKLQIYGENSPYTEIMDLTVRGRGNASFLMPKYGLKLEFEKKQSLFDYPLSKHWVLIANFRDKTHIKNYITYKLAKQLKDDYSPRCQFVELFFNRHYLGLYLLVESVKVDKNKVNINKDIGYLLEKTTTTSDKEFFTTESNHLFEVKYPKKPSESQLKSVQKHFNLFESTIKTKAKDIDLNSWIDIDDFIRFYWIQEFPKNYDGRFLRSIFITWEEDGLIGMGPVWDFDLAYGEQRTNVSTPSDWIIRTSGWEKWLMQNKEYDSRSNKFWRQNHSEFQQTINIIDSISPIIEKAVKNDEKRWPILNSKNNIYLVNAYKSHGEAVDSLKSWINQRIDWIDRHL